MITTESVNIHATMTASRISSASVGTSDVGFHIRSADTGLFASFKFVSAGIFALLPMRQIRTVQVTFLTSLITLDESCVTKRLIGVGYSCEKPCLFLSMNHP